MSPTFDSCFSTPSCTMSMPRRFSRCSRHSSPIESGFFVSWYAFSSTRLCSYVTNVYVRLAKRSLVYVRLAKRSLLLSYVTHVYVRLAKCSILRSYVTHVYVRLVKRNLLRSYVTHVYVRLAKCSILRSYYVRTHAKLLQ